MIGYADGPSLYQYGRSNPTHYTDPLGLVANGAYGGVYYNGDPLNPHLRHAMQLVRDHSRSMDRSRLLREQYDRRISQLVDRDLGWGGYGEGPGGWVPRFLDGEDPGGFDPYASGGGSEPNPKCPGEENEHGGCGFLEGVKSENLREFCKENPGAEDCPNSLGELRDGKKEASNSRLSSSDEMLERAAQESPRCQHCHPGATILTPAMPPFVRVGGSVRQRVIVNSQGLRITLRNTTVLPAFASVYVLVEMGSMEVLEKEVLVSNLKPLDIDVPAQWTNLPAAFGVSIFVYNEADVVANFYARQSIPGN